MSKVFGTVSDPPFYISAQNDATVKIKPDVYESRFPKNLKKAGISIQVLYFGPLKMINANAHARGFAPPWTFR